jgi:hypothetical protein
VGRTSSRSSSSSYLTRASKVCGLGCAGLLTAAGITWAAGTGTTHPAVAAVLRGQLNASYPAGSSGELRHQVPRWPSPPPAQSASQDLNQSLAETPPVTATPSPVPSPSPSPAPAPSSSSPAPAPQPAPTGTGGGAGGALGECIRQAEESGSYAWGPGNGGGAYQFQEGTWHTYGGDPYGSGTPLAYGSAGPAAQDQIFLNVVAAGPQAIYDAWQSDGCPQKFGDF